MGDVIDGAQGVAQGVDRGAAGVAEGDAGVVVKPPQLKECNLSKIIYNFIQTEDKNAGNYRCYGC